MKLLSFAMLCVLTACTLSMNQIHTQGSASDVVDENQDANADVSPDISLPISPL